MTDASGFSPAHLIARPLEVVQARLQHLPAERLTKDGDDWDVPAFFVSKLGLGGPNNGLIKQVRVALFSLLFGLFVFISLIFRSHR